MKKRRTGLREWDAIVRSLYFDIQKVDGVKPLEIWNGLREVSDPVELIHLVKNLYKIVIPVVNEELSGRQFAEHSRVAKESVSELLNRLREKPDQLVFGAFPYPPTGDEGQKDLYRALKDEAVSVVKTAADGRTTQASASFFPDGLFDFREMRVVDNELPYIIFTEKEFRVIHGLVIVYLWLIDLETLLMESLEENGVDHEAMVRFWRFHRKVFAEVPLTILGEKTDPRAFIARLSERLKQPDYLDVFEGVYRWSEAARERFLNERAIPPETSGDDSASPKGEQTAGA